MHKKGTENTILGKNCNNSVKLITHPIMASTNHMGNEMSLLRFVSHGLIKFVLVVFLIFLLHKGTNEYYLSARPIGHICFSRCKWYVFFKFATQLR